MREPPPPDLCVPAMLFRHPYVPSSSLSQFPAKLLGAKSFSRRTLSTRLLPRLKFPGLRPTSGPRRHR